MQHRHAAAAAGPLRHGLHAVDDMWRGQVLRLHRDADLGRVHAATAQVPAHHGVGADGGYAGVQASITPRASRSSTSRRPCLLSGVGQMLGGRVAWTKWLGGLLEQPGFRLQQ